MTYKDVADSVSKFGGILFTPIIYNYIYNIYIITAVACYASGPMKVRLSFRSQNLPPSPPKPLHKHWYIHQHLVTAHFSHLTKQMCHCMLWLLLPLRFTVGWNINTGQWSENAFLTRKVVSGVIYPCNSDKSNAQKLEIPTNINVYSYRRAHRPASCSVGVIFRGCIII
jgi:hypothetical protein